MGYTVKKINGELAEYAFDFGGVIALRNFTARTNGNRLIIQSAENANFTILDALVNEVEIDGVVYDDVTSAQEALQRLVFNPNPPVILKRSEYLFLKNAMACCENVKRRLERLERMHDGDNMIGVIFPNGNCCKEQKKETVRIIFPNGNCCKETPRVKLTFPNGNCCKEVADSVSLIFPDGACCKEKQKVIKRVIYKEPEGFQPVIDDKYKGLKEFYMFIKKADEWGGEISFEPYKNFDFSNSQNLGGYYNNFVAPLRTYAKEILIGFRLKKGSENKTFRELMPEDMEEVSQWYKYEDLVK